MDYTPLHPQGKVKTNPRSQQGVDNTCDVEMDKRTHTHTHHTYTHIYIKSYSSTRYPSPDIQKSNSSNVRRVSMIQHRGELLPRQFQGEEFVQKAKSSGHNPPSSHSTHLFMCALNRTHGQKQWRDCN